MRRMILVLAAVALSSICAPSLYSQTAQQKVDRGSKTARDGFKNENEIAEKFIRWRTDAEARLWLATMGYAFGDVRDVATSKPHGEKADIRVAVTTAKGTEVHRISIKLVSSENGFNQIDKRWLRQYAAAWKMPDDVMKALRLYVGEDAPTGKSRVANRMYIDELEKPQQEAIVRFFEVNRENIVSDLLEGDGADRADWFLVAWKDSEKPKWTLRRISEVVSFFGEGKVEITRAGNLKIGRISMQRKGGDGGRETAKMLQFKLNPTLLFDRR